MPIKPSPTIAGKLRKLFNNNKQTIEPAIGGSGGGVNVLTLYVNTINTAPNSPPSKAYKNPERTEEYESYIEALDAINNADIIQIVDKAAIVYTATNKAAMYDSETDSSVMVTINTMTALTQVALWYVFKIM